MFVPAADCDSGEVESMNAIILASASRVKGMQALHTHSYEEQLLHCEEGLAELGRVTREDGTGLQHLTQNLSYTLQLDMAECYACMVSSICPCQVNPICLMSP